MPAAAALAEVGIVFAQFVGPARDAGQRRIGFAYQQPGDLRAGLRREVVPRERGDEAMAETAPRVRRMRHEEQGYDEGGKNAGHAGILAGTALREDCRPSAFARQAMHRGAIRTS